jgi:hypothetical protein
MKTTVRFFHLIAISLLTLAASSAQSASGGGTIQGTVSDTSGAAVPSAKLAILHIDTGRATNTTSNNEGYFTTPPLSIGKYKLRVEAAGMKAWQEEVLLETGKTVEVNPVLAPGQVSETIQVSASIPLVTTSDPTDASTLDSQRIKELPINGRDLNTLLGDVAPGIEPIIDVNGGVRAGGLMVYSNSYVQDGAASNNREFGGSMNLQGLESVGEVRVETSTSSAKYNTPTSIIVTSKSGTNRFHVGMYETARNNAFGVARARQDVSFGAVPYNTPKLIRNEFGGSIGGPIILPKIYNGRNRTFFFVSREGVQLRQGLTKNFSVPTLAMRQGDFSDLYDSTGRFIQLYDPLTTRLEVQPNGRTVAVRDRFVNNQIPINRMSPLAKAIWGITPMPNDITSPVITTNLKVAVPTNGNPDFSDNPTTIRIDHRLSERDNFFLKTNGGRRLAYFQGTGTGTGAPTIHNEANVTYLPMQAIAGVLSWTHMFSSTFFVENTAAQTWQSTKTVTGPVNQQQNWSQALGLPNPYGEIGFPNITSLGNLMTYTEGDNRRALTSRILSLQQNYNLVRRTHNIQFGWSSYSENQHLLPDQGAISGSAAFNSQATALESTTLGSDTAPQAVPQTGYDAANFFLGYAGSYSMALKRSYLRLHDKNIGMYLQDNYKVNSRLTITPGLRWDMNPAMTEDNYQLNGYDVASHTVMLPQPLDYYYTRNLTTPQVVTAFEKAGVTFSSAEQLGKSKSIFPSNYFDIGPRAGFAYVAFGGARQLVIRGGYGIYISAIPMRTLLAQFSGMAPFRAGFSFNPNSAAQSPDRIQNYLLRSVPANIAGSNSSDVIDLNNPSAIGRGVGVVGIDPNFPDLRIHEWNLTLEKQLSSTTVFRVRYNGKHGVNADQLNEINPSPTNYVWYTETGRQVPATPGNRAFDSVNYGSIRLLAKTGFINSETFVIEGERRFSKGLGFQAFYTLTNSLRAAGNSFRDSIGTLPAQFLPGTTPTDAGELNRFLNYSRDTGLPKHRVRWNFSYDVPAGKGRRFAGSANKFVNGVIGGWKLAGTGTVVSSWWAVPTNNWGPIGELQVYGNKYPILDCRATSATAKNASDERCYEGYLYFNGYISQRQIASRNAAGLRNGVFGLPADYKAFQGPINPWPVGGQATDPGNSQYDTNNVNIRLQNGSTVQVGYDTGLHPMRNQYRLGPFNWTQDATMMKFFNLTERMRLRVNVDVFNVFNTQGLNTPGSDGIVTLRDSYGGFGLRPRQVQITMRLDW